jgi:CcmD family protein
MDPREYQYVFAGLTIVWLVVTVYVVTLVLRERRLRAELDRVRRMVEKN